MMSTRGCVVLCLQPLLCVFGPAERVSREEECERILSLSDDRDVVFEALNAQFRLIHNRAQILLGICGVLLSTSVVLMTGKIIGQRKLEHQGVIAHLLLGAGATEIAALAMVIIGVLRIQWMTELPGKDVRAWVMTSLAYRDAKTRAYRISILLILISMVLFQTASTLAWVQL